MKKIISLFFILIAFYANACECPSVEPISKKSAELYDVIFYGKVDSIIPCSTKGIGTAYFTISNLYKGAAEQHVSVDYDCTSACMMSFSKNDEWIIYAIYQRFNLMTVDICSHSRKKISDSSQDFYQVSSHRTFEEENDFLKATLGIQSYSSHNELNNQQKDLKPHNDQPSSIDKLWLLLISCAAMIIIFIVSKKYFKNGK